MDRHAPGHNRCVQGGAVKIQVAIGERVKHEIQAFYLPLLRLMRVRIDGRLVYQHCALLPWATRRPQEFRSPGPEVHFYLVDPPGWRDPFTGTVLDGYRLWLDGQPVAMIGARRGAVGAGGIPA
jgi:hypothetical protein